MGQLLYHFLFYFSFQLALYGHHMLSVTQLEEFEEGHMLIEAHDKVFVIATLLNGPTRFGNGNKAGEGEVFQRLIVKHVFRPEVCLNALVAGKERLINAIGGDVGIHAFQGFVTMSLRTRFIGVSALAAVNIIRNLGREDVVKTALCSILGCS